MNQIKGIPDGYEIVRFGQVDDGDIYLNRYGIPTESHCSLAEKYLVIRQIHTTVKLYNYLICHNTDKNGNKTWPAYRTVICDEAYAKATTEKYGCVCTKLDAAPVREIVLPTS